MNSSTKFVTSSLTALDNSDSMISSPKKMELVKAICDSIYDTIFVEKGYDIGSIILFDDKTTEVFPPQPLSNQDSNTMQKINALLNDDGDFKTKGGGMTRLWEPIYVLVIDMWEKIVQENPSAYVVTHVNIVTDGEDNRSQGEFSGTDGVHHLVKELAKKDIHVCLNLIALGGSFTEQAKGQLIKESLASGGVFMHIPENLNPVDVSQTVRNNFVKPINKPIEIAKNQNTPEESIEKYVELINGQKFHLNLTGDFTKASELYQQWDAMKNSSDRHYRALLFATGGDEEKAKQAFLQAELSPPNPNTP